MSAALTGTPQAARLDGTDWLFRIYLMLLVVEFVGLANVIPLLKVTRLSTLVAWVLFISVLRRTGLEAVTNSNLSKLLAAFVVFTGVTVVYALINTSALTAFRAHVDYFGLFVTTMYLVDRPERIRQFALIACMIALVLCVRNAEKLTSTVRVGSFAAGYFLGNGNDFAWGMNVLLPFALYLASTQERFLVRLMGAAGAGAAIAGIVGTQSRGAALALAAAGLFYWFFLVKRKSFGVIAIAVVVVGVIVAAPPEYFERLETIENFEEDNSAMSRFTVWLAATEMAIDYPLGVGANNFASVYGRYYIPSEGESLMTWGQNKWMSAHSVYFRLLGEYGVLGVIWMATILLTNFRENLASWQRLKAAGVTAALPAQFPMFVNMSLIGYAVSGLFLGGVTYPHLYLISALTVSVSRQCLHGAGVLTDPAQSRAMLPAPRSASSLVEVVADRARIAMSLRRKAS
jgi:probable O-glycosylation ligase (exosortase A-associated)